MGVVEVSILHQLLLHLPPPLEVPVHVLPVTDVMEPECRNRWHPTLVPSHTSMALQLNHWTSCHRNGRGPIALYKVARDICSVQCPSDDVVNSRMSRVLAFAESAALDTTCCITAMQSWTLLAPHNGTYVLLPEYIIIDPYLEHESKCR